MNNPPKNPTNLKKNLLFFIKDISNNDPFLDHSGNIFINPLFDPLQGWEKNKNTLLLEDNNNNIKKKGDSFTMRLDSIIDEIRKERKQNATKCTNEEFIQN